MAYSIPGMSRMIYDTFAPSYAEDWALAVNPGHPLLGGFDKARYDEDYARFLEGVDTPEKLFKIASALNPGTNS